MQGHAKKGRQGLMSYQVDVKPPKGHAQAKRQSEDGEQTPPPCSFYASGTLHRMLYGCWVECPSPPYMRCTRLKSNASGVLHHGSREGTST